MESIVYQLDDDPDLLELMLADQEQADEIFQPPQYWKHRFSDGVEELRRLGLVDVRRRRGSALEGLGVLDLAHDGGEETLPYGLSPANLRDTAWRLARALGRIAGAHDPVGCPSDLAGNPGGVFLADGRPYTMRTLRSYLRYVYCHNFVNFSELSLIVEIGPGLGSQVEVIAKLHPRISFFVFDLAPALYICETYLKSVFHDRVVSYRQTRDWTALPRPEPGFIYICSSDRLPLLSTVPAPISLVMSASVLGTLELDVARAYADYFQAEANAIYLMDNMGGMHHSVPSAGVAGVKSPVTLTDFRGMLSEFALTDLRQAYDPLGPIVDNHDSFWTRRVARPHAVSADPSRGRR